MKPVPSRTTNPLHFEDLEPHRFEDLVRQLIYGFRTWVMLEAIGRSGSDEGVDIRGIERVPPVLEDHEEGGPDEGDERIWFIQCKRERQFGPAKATKAATAALAGDVDPPYGFVLAVAADVSRQARAALNAVLGEAGVEQAIVWGRGELEDLLFRPENDHLLFAYFGVSLRVQRRAVTTGLRSKLAMKRQLFRSLGDLEFSGETPVLLRDPTVGGYPFKDRVEQWDDAYPAWMWVNFEEHSNPDQVALVLSRFHAWITPNRKSYDFVEGCSDFDPSSERSTEACEQLRLYHGQEIPVDQRAWLLTVGWIPYEHILIVDDLGDGFNDPPHLLVERTHDFGFFSHIKQFVEIGRAAHREILEAADLRRRRLFPDSIPKTEWDRKW